MLASLLIGVCCVASQMTTGCVSVKTEHRIEPIQITMDVNVRLERELEESFAELDARSREIAAKHSGESGDFDDFDEFAELDGMGVTDEKGSE